MGPDAAKPGQDDGASPQIPPGQFCGMWKLDRYSDARIRVLSAQASEQNSCGQANLASIVVYKEIPVHKAVLEAGSSYFKGLFTTGQDMAAVRAQNDAEPAAKRIKMEEAHQVIDLPCDSEEDANATEAVLEFMYNHKLPATPTVSMLLKMITTADYLGADVCVTACILGISNLPINQDDMLKVCNVLDKLRNCSTLDKTAMGKLHTALSVCMLEAYGDVVSIINSDDQLASFCKLPLSSIEVWGRMDKLQADSENSVVVLLNRWWHSQAEGIKTEDCKNILSGLIRLPFLSSGYLLHALNRLAWFVAPFPEYGCACTILNTVGADEVDLYDAPFSRLNTVMRNSPAQTYLDIEWRLSLEQIQQAASATTDRCIQGPERYWQGHIWSLDVEVPLNHQGDPTHLLAVEVGVRTKAVTSMPVGIPTSARISGVEPPFEFAWKQTMFMKGAASLSFTKGFAQQDVGAALHRYLTDDMQLVIKVRFDDVL